MARLALLSICVGLVQLLAVEQGCVDQVEEQFFQISLGGALERNVVHFPITDVHASHVLVVHEETLFVFCLSTPAGVPTSTIPAVAAVLSISTRL